MDDADRADIIIDAGIQNGINAILHAPKETPAFKDGERICIKCGSSIPIPRLQAEPNAVRCVRCQQAHELIRKRYV